VYTLTFVVVVVVVVALLICARSHSFEDSDVDCQQEKGVYWAAAATILFVVAACVHCASPRFDPFCVHFGRRLRPATTEKTDQQRRIVVVSTDDTNSDSVALEEGVPDSKTHLQPTNKARASPGKREDRNFSATGVLRRTTERRHQFYFSRNDVTLRVLRDRGPESGGVPGFCCQMLPNVAKCCQMLPNVAKCCQMLPSVAKCCQVLPNVAKCCNQLLRGVTFVE